MSRVPADSRRSLVSLGRFFSGMLCPKAVASPTPPVGTRSPRGFRRSTRSERAARTLAGHLGNPYSNRTFACSLRLELFPDAGYRSTRWFMWDAGLRGIGAERRGAEADRGLLENVELNTLNKKTRLSHGSIREVHINHRSNGCCRAAAVQSCD